MVGIPSGLSFPLLLGMYTRLTGRAHHGAVDRCRRSASSALSRDPSASFPSIPAVLRPAFNSVTCRTLSRTYLVFGTGRVADRGLCRCAGGGLGVLSGYLRVSGTGVPSSWKARAWTGVGVVSLR